MSRSRVAAAVAITALMAAAPVAAAHADEADTTKPAIADSVFAPVKGTATFGLSQVEANPAKTYVEIQQLDEAGKWKKKAGSWFFDTNAFSFTVDTSDLAEGVATQLKVSTWDEAGNQAGKAFPVVIDRTKPVATLATPTSSGPVNDSTLDLRIDATDNAGLNRITGNIYRGSTLVKSTSSAVGGTRSGSHTASVVLPDGEYAIRYNASDLAGNIASTGTFPVEIDTTAPSIAFKPGAEAPNGTVYTSVPSFKLSDAGVGEIDYVVVNGKTYDRANNKWSDLNAGDYAARQGTNTVTLFDTAGNSSELAFELDTVLPTVAGIAQEFQAKEGGRIAVTLTFSEPIAAASLGQGWNGSGQTFTKVFYRVKDVAVSFADVAGNVGSGSFTVIPVVAPAL